ncbi:PAS/PAC sensor signal transduction histidine kinase [Paracidovorax valerianellae]|uniref:histidine kinase n=1 Tax=Paracidovorax valerianellae TaxID=187868 RepID=A0A1G6T0G1_9BURK|nr:ATP-binding protein [Paracidovorax valerianellae]SDD21996.1 PAS/PAC sensor signal transduction histidine kinase [Paracidovorax valerianellae]
MARRIPTPHLSAVERRPRFRGLPASGIVLVAGLAAALLAAVAVALLAMNDMRTTMAASQAQAQLLARIIESQAARTIEAGDMALGMLAHSPAMTEARPDREAMESAMRQVLVGLSFMRGVAAVDTKGLVIASTVSGEAGTYIDVSKLGPWTEEEHERIGPLIQGRGLGSLRRTTAPDTSPPGISFIPLLRGFRTDGGKDLMIVGLMNPGALSNFQYLTLESLSYDAVIASDDGQVLATSAPTAALVGQRIDGLPIFHSYLPQRDIASYVGQGVLGSDRILAFRASRDKPLVAIVEEPLAMAQSRWLQGAKSFLGIGLAAVLLALGLTATAWRGLRSREAAQRSMNLAQRKIAQSQHDLAVLISSVQELIFRTDAQGVITYANARWDTLSGRSPSHAVGQKLQDIVDSVSRSDVTAMLDTASTAQARTCQALIRTAEGRHLLFELAVVPLISEGRIAGFAGSAVDVTERWQAQLKLHAQLAFQNLLLDTNPLPMSLTDTNQCLVLVNRAWEEYKGQPRAQVIGEKLHAFLPHEEATVLEEANRQLLARGGQVTLETRLLHGDGSRRDARIFKAAVTDEAGQATGVLSILMDVTDFRMAERAIQEARDAAEEASRTKSEFVANMSHELRTPLQSIIGFAELGTLGSPRSPTDPRLAAMFGDIHSAGQRMLTLVNDLLDVAKIESTVGTFHLERIDLRGLIRSVAREFEPLLARHRLHLQLDLPDLPLVAKADPLRFQQVVRNVLANAVKFSPGGSTIELRGFLDGLTQIHIEVEDQGPGIPDEELERIFEAFVQSSKTRDGSGGTGLGLAICRKIVETFGGRIHARNAAQGSVFHIVLPARGFSETMPAPLAALA